MDHIRMEIDEFRSRCTGCGACRRVCPAMRHGGLDPVAIMSGGTDLLETCIACGNCQKACGFTDPYAVVRDLTYLAKGLRISQNFRETGLSMPLADVPGRDLEPEWSGDDVTVIPGCVVKCKVPYVEFAAASALNSMGFGCREIPDITCCLHPIMFREMTREQRGGRRREVFDTAYSPVVTLCGGCQEEFEGAGRECDHFIHFIHRHLGDLPRFPRRIRVALEPGCAAVPYADKMIEAVEAMNCEYIGNTWGCCGKSSPVAKDLMAEREEECRGAELIVVGCPMCLVKFDAQPDGMPVVHISELVAMAAGDRRSLAYHRIPVDAGQKD